MLEGFGTAAPSEPFTLPPVLPVLPLRDLVLFPQIIVPLSVSREGSVRAVDEALAEKRALLLLTQRSAVVDSPGEADLHRLGTVALIVRILRLPDRRLRILVQGVGRARVDGIEQSGPGLRARVSPVGEDEPLPGLELGARIRSVKSGLERLVALGKSVSSEVIVIANNLDDAGRLADLAASNLELKPDEAQGLLEMVDPARRLEAVLHLLNREAEVLEMQQRIASEARSEIDRSQREYYLRQQLRAIERELGEGGELGSEVAQLRERVRGLNLPAPAAEEVLKQADRLARMAPDGAETATLRGWLDWATTLPWGRLTRDRIDLGRARRVLDADHFGLDAVKERILELLAVRKLRGPGRLPALCFVGPPGVGKTSLGQSIARSLGRRFVRVSLGGVRDEAEIRGHRRTYVAALPGRILQGLHQAQTANPVFVIDEIDKLGNDFRGDPSAALLEVLDPEQNHSFRDHYLGLAFDLSGVFFIATANHLDPLEPAFRDRLETIEIPGYSEEEKVEIARRHLLPRQRLACGLGRTTLELSDEALLGLVRSYTREAGLRGLERQLGAIGRKVARQVVEGGARRVRVGRDDLALYLGPPRAVVEAPREDGVGVVRGLAWTPLGGEVLTIEALLVPGKGELLLTGQMGSVMRESAQAALSFLRANARALALDEALLARHDAHVHVPEGAVPKDGPSAGAAIAVALASVLSGRPVRADWAVTGEMTLRGAVLPVGGIREKVMAARRVGLSRVALPRANQADLAELPKVLLHDLEVHFVSQVQDLLGLLLAEEQAS